ncbi:uncharacterized protein LOC135481786 [Liolophura sinensis]|uniref:uncharacterized protein LOC135481786 n=1 Tax=Liolophura sinensis TaxID=3198878 RepID=UPI003158174D
MAAADTNGNQRLGDTDGVGDQIHGTGDGTSTGIDQPTYLVIDYGDTWRHQLDEVRADYQRQLDGVRQELRLMGNWLKAYFMMVLPVMMAVFTHLLSQEMPLYPELQNFMDSILLCLAVFVLLFGLPQFAQRTLEYHQFLLTNGSGAAEGEDVSVKDVLGDTSSSSSECEEPDTTGENPSQETSVNDTERSEVSENDIPTGTLVDFD